jgi:DNA-binding FadR family transcriptional regulator
MTTRVQQTARELAELSLAGEAGRYLGNEDELLTRFSVSRPTLRQAARMVVNDRLIDVRRGSGGGFYASRPDAADSVRTLARYLRLKGASLSDILVVAGPVSEEAAALAAQSTDAALRSHLIAFSRRIDENDTPAAVVKAEADLARTLASMSGNAAVELVMAIGYSFGFDEKGVVLYASPEDRAQARQWQHALVEAVLSGDADVSRLMMRRRSALISGWLARFAGAGGG